MRFAFSPAQSALIELGILFLPGIPAVIWLWPRVAGTEWNTPIQSAVYVYFIAGALFIGLRRWSWDQLGLNRKGIWFALACGAVLIAGRLLVLAATSIALSFQFARIDRIIGETIYYFLLVGFGEELVFRGLMYRALDEWRGTRWAIWGSSLGFGLFHLGHGDPTIAVGVLIGAVFAAIRWRAGGIVGLIIVHALYDLSTVAIMPDLSLNYLIAQVQIHSWFLVALGYAMMIGVGMYLWKAPLRRNDMRPGNWYNPFVAFVLRSPLHIILSRSMMLVSVTGKKSGKRLALPVNYLCSGGEFFTVSWRNRTWWRNLCGGAPAVLRVKGQDLQSVGQAITDDASVSAELARYLEQVPQYAKYFRIALDADGKPSAADIAQAARGRVMVRFRVSPK